MTYGLRQIRRWLHISIHTSAREVTNRLAIGQIADQFQSTLPQGKWRSSVQMLDYCREFQSTLPQGKWRGYPYRCGATWDISIHTSAREVTGIKYPFPSWRLNFNPHFRKGSDIIRSLHKRQPLDFNPHFRKGSDQWHPVPVQVLLNFNPHFRKGSDLFNEDGSPMIDEFQSTLPQGKWP